jgi:hypothetical protein
MASGDGLDVRPDRGGTLGLGGPFAQSGSETLDQNRHANRQLDESNRVPRQATTVPDVSSNVEADVTSCHVDRIVLQSPERPDYERHTAQEQTIRAFHVQRSSFSPSVGAGLPSVHRYGTRPASPLQGDPSL